VINELNTVRGAVAGVLVGVKLNALLV